MKKFIKILYLFIVPASLICFDVSVYMADKVEVFTENYSLLSIIGLFHVVFALGMYHAYKMDVKVGWNTLLITKLFKIELEKAPGIGLWIGIDHGFILVIPFVVIRFALIKKKKKKAPQYTTV